MTLGWRRASRARSAGGCGCLPWSGASGCQRRLPACWTRRCPAPRTWRASSERREAGPMATDLFEGVNGRDVLGARANRGGMTVIARPRRWTAWLGRDGAAQAPRPAADRAGRWLRTAMAALGALALAAAAVSYQAQYAMVLAYKGSRIIAAVQAAIPDAGALVFASLGIALALQGKRAIRPRVLNVACVAISIAMNALAAAAGWTALAVWVMAPVLYALASDTLVAAIRAWSIARQRELAEDLADDDGSPLAIVGGVLLWLLRLALAPPSTVKGFRSWVVDEVRVAPGRTAGQLAAPAQVLALAPAPQASAAARQPGRAAGRAGTKTAQFLALVQARHGHLAALPLADVSRVCSELAGDVGLNAGAARTALRAAVLAAQNGGGTA